VFTDVVMPGMTGMSWRKRSAAYHADLPVVLTSGYSHVLSESGSDGFEVLQKPYSMGSSRACCTGSPAGAG